MFRAVVTPEPPCSSLRVEPKRKVNREMRVDTFRLHGFNNFERVTDLGHVHFAILVEIIPVDAHHINSSLGQHTRALAQGVSAERARRTVDGPKANTRAISSEIGRASCRERV